MDPYEYDMAKGELILDFILRAYTKLLCAIVGLSRQSMQTPTQTQATYLNRYLSYPHSHVLDLSCMAKNYQKTAYWDFFCS